MKLNCNFCNCAISKKSPTTAYLNGKAFCCAECRRDYTYYGSRLDRARDNFRDSPVREPEPTSVLIDPGEAQKEMQLEG